MSNFPNKLNTRIFLSRLALSTREVSLPVRSSGELARTRNMAIREILLDFAQELCVALPKIGLTYCVRH